MASEVCGLTGEVEHSPMEEVMWKIICLWTQENLCALSWSGCKLTREAEVSQGGLPGGGLWAILFFFLLASGIGRDGWGQLGDPPPKLCGSVSVRPGGMPMSSGFICPVGKGCMECSVDSLKPLWGCQGWQRCPSGSQAWWEMLGHVSCVCWSWPQGCFLRPLILPPVAQVIISSHLDWLMVSSLITLQLLWTLIFFFPTWPPILSVFPVAPGVTSFKMCIWKTLSWLPALWTFQAKFLAWLGCHPPAQHHLQQPFSSLRVLSCWRAFALAAALLEHLYLLSLSGDYLFILHFSARASSKSGTFPSELFPS